MMKKYIFNILIFCAFSCSFFGTTFASGPSETIELYCDGIDGEKMPLGVRDFVTCETDPNTKENIIVRYCYRSEEGKALWSQNHSIFSSEGC